MKILWNFKTNLDQESIHEKSFIIKQYPMYIVSFKNLLIYLAFFWNLYLFILYQQTVFWNSIWTILNVIYGSLIWYWLYNQWKFLWYYIKHFQVYYDLKNKHILEKQDVVFDKTLIISMIMLSINLLSSIWASIYWIYSSNTDFINLGIYIISNLWLIALQWMIIKAALIDFEMNFTVIDWNLMKVNQITQTWFFNIHYNWATFDLISSIDWNSSWIIRIWKQYWYIEIATMGDTPNVTITYVKRPEFIADLILTAKNKKFWKLED